MAEGPARIELTIDKPGEGWRQVDAVCVTDDPAFTPVGREKPPFAYLDSFALHPKDGPAWRGSGKELTSQPPRPKLGGRDFGMWTQVEPDPKWWAAQNLDALTRYDVFFRFSPPQDIRDKFHAQFAGRKDLPILSWPGLTPGFYLGSSPDPWGGTRIGFSATTEINRKDWGLNWNVALETGGVLVGEKVKLNLEIAISPEHVELAHAGRQRAAGEEAHDRIPADDAGDGHRLAAGGS